MIDQTYNRTAYAFCIDEMKYRCYYYRTISIFSGHIADHGRDERKAHPVNVAAFSYIMNHLKQPVRWVRNDEDLSAWLISFGWALVSGDYANQKFPELLKPRICLKSAIGLFWDVRLPRDRAISHRIPKETRQIILERDGNQCIECGRAEQDGINLTMDHVIPFSRGGETTEGNLVTLCEKCNQAHSNAPHPHLFVLAGLDHGWDPRFFQGRAILDADSKASAVMLSQNIMVSRCRANALRASDTKQIESGAR